MTRLLPAPFLVKTPQEADLEAIHAMLTACDLADCGQPDSPLEELRSEWRDPQFQAETDAWLILTPDEQLVGYAKVRIRQAVRAYFVVRVHPAYRQQGIEEYLLELVEKRSAEFVLLAPPEARVELQTVLHRNDLAGHQFLEQQGYACTRSHWAMTIQLSEAPVQPLWPQGITLRPFVPERDARAVFEADEEAFKDHWGYLSNSFERWYRRHITNHEGFDPSLWFIAVDGEQVAGIALCGYFLQDGSVDILGIRRPWRRAGLGLALLHHAFGEFYRRGVRKVGLGVDAQSLTGATRLYERAGMAIELQFDIYEKELRAGVDHSTRTLEH